MTEKQIVIELPFSFRNVGVLNSTSANILAAPALVIEELYCTMGDVKVQVNFTREAERSEMLKRRQQARRQKKEALPSESWSNGTIIQPIKDGVGGNFLHIPKGVEHNNQFIAQQCFPADWRETLKLWEIVVYENRLRFIFCDTNEPNRDKDNMRAAVDLNGVLTLEGRFRAMAFNDEPERLLFVRFGDDPTIGGGSFIEMTTGTAKNGIVHTRFYPTANLKHFDKIVQSS